VFVPVVFSILHGRDRKASVPLGEPHAA
jgi:hypothetical protein